MDKAVLRLRTLPLGITWSEDENKMPSNRRYHQNTLLKPPSLSAVFTQNETTLRAVRTCAGVCSYEGRGGLCSVRLSEPLLKLRPRKDLVQTLLHEMIHALLFVTQNNRDRDGHGPEFCKHMNRINQASGTNITIYHSFHDEVDVYRQHWWRCNGPCQNHRPFFGYVKRAMNRPPSARDPWWSEHQRTCGGTYTKIKEPENYGKTGKSDKKKDKNPSDKTSKNTKPPFIFGTQIKIFLMNSESSLTLP
uniref:SprT-like N-terminal domain n=1 Tax=Sinocyclocheilus grahami TaxID=75366 RepID=A0A672N003_SINGR